MCQSVGQGQLRCLWAQAVLLGYLGSGPCSSYACSPRSAEVSHGVSFFWPLGLSTHNCALQLEELTEGPRTGVLPGHGMGSRASRVGREEGRGPCWRQHGEAPKLVTGYCEAPSEVSVLPREVSGLCLPTPRFSETAPPTLAAQHTFISPVRSPLPLATAIGAGGSHDPQATE